MTTTRAPERASNCAAAAPIPPVEPVTTTTSFVRSKVRSSRFGDVWIGSPKLVGTNYVCAVNVAMDLLSAAGRWPDAPALHDGDVTWSYARLAEEAGRFATHCGTLGLAHGDRVALVLGSWPEHVAAWYGVLMAGCVAVDLNTLLGDEEWHAILAGAGPSWLVSDAAFVPRLATVVPPTVRHLTGLSDRGAGFPFDAMPQRSAQAAQAATAAVIAYTSGTTGQPKGVVHTHGAVCRQLDLLEGLHRLAPGESIYQAVPLFALQGYIPQVASAIRGGASVVLADKFSPADFANASRRHRIVYVTLSSPMLTQMTKFADDDRPNLSALRVVTVGGAPLHPDRACRV